MLIIKMEASTRNYIYRLLENYKENLKYSRLTPRKLQYEYQQIEIAMNRLMGKEPKIALDKNTSQINYLSGDIK